MIKSLAVLQRAGLAFVVAVLMFCFVVVTCWGLAGQPKLRAVRVVDPYAQQLQDENTSLRGEISQLHDLLDSCLGMQKERN